MARISAAERQRTMDFVIEQRMLARSDRAWRRRLAQFGYGLEDTEQGHRVTWLPYRRPICVVPAGLTG
ncbi:hypothetical protein [Maritimibacter fusiformis]|jgi:hypothetical protein|uniref:Uncharacterized protein n=1 Tax=Maritimibacter fusiformis TaxID=2603819 RepID=A0A5D0R838_9RHOB|nr:hypothetical protein [Maritimibacter fusiformis]TYB77637.1 hypothetical protein FVF75_15355 [Maritimibacter fusiformis]